ncbi:Protein dispatched-like protein 1 [Hypsibius exemplaris]|uniref:Protein dispatched-like protein 1 n=1 Tax=Hypsibius exemplaris TaxID=2072580 RepID=A0A1W0WWK2_HYPEX|nr:Protein dispatched-like protein 1 [Hypsibius exemplaris]
MPRQLVRRRKKTVMQRYAHFLAHHPFLILTLTFCANIVLLLVIVCTDSLPAFDDPQAGFEPRGSLINQRAQAWRNFLERDGVVQPSTRRKATTTKPVAARQNAPVQEIGTGNGDADYDFVEGLRNSTVKENVFSSSGMASLGPITQPRGFFCSRPLLGHAKLILRRKDAGNLLNLEGIRELCQLDADIRRLDEFQSCSEESADTGRLCRTWNLPNYVAVLAGKTSCHQLEEHDIRNVLNLTATCLPFYRSGQLKADCSTSEDDGKTMQEDTITCPGVPTDCIKDSSIYHLLYFISDKESRETGYSSMKHTLAVLPVWSSPAALPLYRALQWGNFTRPDDDGPIQVIGMEMGLGDRLFNTALLEDTLYVGVAAGVVVVVLWLYTGSLFVTLMNLMAIFFSLVVSYFLYVFVFRLTFFPFMNLLTCVIIVAIGADALVIFARLWHLAKTEKDDGRFEKVVHATFRHAAQAILVSSLTASAALFSDIVNPIIAIRCFSIFAGLTVLVHLFFAVTWMPACFVVADKWGSSVYVCGVFAGTLLSCDTKSPVCRLLYRCRCLHSGLRQYCDYFRIFFEKLLPCLVIRLKWMWMASFVLLTVGACVVVFVFPGLQLASGRTFSLWNSGHPSEQYRLLKDRFAFEENRNLNNNEKVSLHFVWGVLALNQAALLDPTDTGITTMDGRFNMSDPLSQIWMLKFCADLRQQTFFDNSTQSDNACYFDSFMLWMETGACSGHSQFPYPPATFIRCVHTFSNSFPQAKHFGPNFNSLHQIDSFVLRLQTSQLFSHSYTAMQQLHQHVDQWFTAALRTAPPSLQGAWFTGDFAFFDLQQSLISGTALSLIVSLFVAFLVLFFTTLNVGVSLIAITVIAGIMLATTAALVLMEWQLSVFESTIIGLAIGLSVDFTLHYAVSYCCAESYEERELKTNIVISEMASCVTMSAVTTFLAGALMIPSDILFYRQLGLFIITVTAISLLYATIFLPACLAVLGPQGAFLQFHYPSCRPLCCRPDPSKLVEKSMHSSAEFDTTYTTGGTYDHHRETKQCFHQSINQPYQGKALRSPSAAANNHHVVVISATPEQPPKTHPALLLDVDPDLADEETDSVGELGSVPTSRGPSRGTSLIRRSQQASRGIFPWDYIMQRLPLSRHFSVAGSSVIYIDADVRSVTSSMGLEGPAVLPNRREDVPEVWVRRTTE